MAVDADQLMEAFSVADWLDLSACCGCGRPVLYHIGDPVAVCDDCAPQVLGVADAAPAIESDGQKLAWDRRRLEGLRSVARTLRQQLDAMDAILAEVASEDLRADQDAA